MKKNMFVKLFGIVSVLTLAACSNTNDSAGQEESTGAAASSTEVSSSAAPTTVEVTTSLFDMELLGTFLGLRHRIDAQLRKRIPCLSSL